jgi:ABC-type multidrug transport system fused ATPase/permease subunit
MINRFYDPEEGTLSYDTTNLKDIDLNALRGKIGYVGQEPVLIVGTIRENLSYGNSQATEEDMREALSLASAGFVFRLKEGLDTYVGSSTVLNLSGG